MLTLSGPASAAPHGTGADVGMKFEKGHGVVTIIVGRLSGLVVENERTILVGKPSDKQLSAFQAATEACEAAAAKMGFSAYGVTQGDDPVSQAMKGLIDNAAGHEHQIALLWAAIEKLSASARDLPAPACVPADAHTTETFDAERLNRLVK